MIIGFMTQRNGRIRYRCEGDLVSISTGIWQGKVGALEIVDGSYYELYPNKEKQLLLADHYPNAPFEFNKPSEQGMKRVIAVGDLHGDYESALAVLYVSGVIDEKGDWKCQGCIVVQTGDFVDRGPQTKKVIEMLQRLQEEALQFDSEVR
jgi:Calcineurin-like phosphoesterase